MTHKAISSSTDWPIEGYVSVKSLAKRYSVSVATIWRWSQKSNFPNPKTFNGATRWTVSEVLEWEQKAKGGGRS